VGNVLDNQKFWNERYVTLPELGSGPGSRGYAAWFKQRLIEDALATKQYRSLLDIGCGDLCWLRKGALGDVAYTGLDISDVVVKKNKEQFPEYKFLVHDIAESPPNEPADLVVCFDVLLHQIEPADFTAALKNTLAAIGKVGMISYITPDRSYAPLLDDVPEDALRDEEEFQRFTRGAKKKFPTAETAFHGELPERIKQALPNAQVRTFGAYRFQTVYEVIPSS
jgi:trans-aconitate methyltransferase